jgi:large subunit ribosomal protein L6
MKHLILEKIQIPEGVSCSYENRKLTCSKGSSSSQRKIILPETTIKTENNELVFECKKGNKTNYKKIMSCVAHVNNMFSGLNETFVYHLESCNVHFPMTMKLDKNTIIINNFFGEKVPRKAKVLPGVDVKIDGPKITVSSNDREAAGQTAANLEKATRLVGRDRRIFQDGIYITGKPGRRA